jgi:hypothetical protein
MFNGMGHCCVGEGVGNIVANMPQPCSAAYRCLEGMWLPTLGHCCLSSITYIGDSHYLDIISINAVIINAHFRSHSVICVNAPPVKRHLFV